MGFAWPAHRRGRDRSRQRRNRKSDRTGGGVDRHRRSRRASRPRSCLRRIRRRTRGRRRQPGDRRRTERPGFERSGRDRLDHDPSRRDGGPQPARRQRHRRVVDGGAPGSRRRGRRSAVAPPGRKQQGADAASRDPDLRRRRACGPARRYPGFHGHVSGREHVLRGFGLERRDLSRRGVADGPGRQAARGRRRRRVLAGVRMASTSSLSTASGWIRPA